MLQKNMKLHNRMKVLITGANGFIGKNLKIHLENIFKEKIVIYSYSRDTSDDDLHEYIKTSDFIFHLAGENRPKSPSGFIESNVDLTQRICDICAKYNPVPILYTSSTQALSDNAYGRSKLEAEIIIKKYSDDADVDFYLYRLPNVFGKWTKPNYNSFVATLCYNVSHDLPCVIDDFEKELSLVHIDDVVKAFVYSLNNAMTKGRSFKCEDVIPLYTRKLGEIFDLLKSFRTVHKDLVIPNAANGFVRALYSTYMSYLPSSQFSYELDDYTDERGSFYEVLKMKDSGQVSVSSTAPGVTRGDHFHHSKCEKFLVIKGSAHFRFRHLISNELVEVYADDSKKKIIEVPAGYTHNFTNIGDDELIVLLWANEVFDRERPDTYFLKVIS